MNYAIPRAPDVARRVSTARAPAAVDPNGVWAHADTTRRAALVRYLDDAGLGLAAIAAHLGATENAISGFCHRRGISLRSTVQPARAPRVFPPDPRRLRPEAWQPLPGAPVRSFLENDGCMWPVIAADGTEGFCGCVIQKGRYCETHHVRSRDPIATAAADKRLSVGRQESTVDRFGDVEEATREAAERARDIRARDIRVRAAAA